MGIKPSPWHGFIPLVVLGVYFSSLILGFLLTITPICLMLISYALVAKKKKRLWGWFWRSGLLLGMYLWLLYGISFYFLDPKYYEFKNQCTQLPQPKIYNQDYWELSFFQNYPLEYDENKQRFYYSAKLDKKLYVIGWDKKIASQTTKWGVTKKEVDRYYGNILYATTTTYAYPYYTLGLGWGSRNGFEFGFKKQEISCYDLEQK